MGEFESQVTEQEIDEGTAGQESVVDSQEEDVTETNQDPGEGDNADPASQRQEGGQSHQDNAAARAARIRAEQETTERLQRHYDEQVAGMGIINPYTGKPFSSFKDFLAYGERGLRMDLQVVEHPDELRVIVVHNAAVAHIQGVDPVHFLLGEGEVPDIKILFHAITVDALWDDYHTPLDIPTQGHLGGSLTVSAANLCQQRIGEDTELTFRKGPPCLRNHAVVRHGLYGLLLVEEGVDFHLVHGWFYFHGLTEVQ